MDGHSLDIRQGNVEALRGLFPSLFSEGKVDLEKVKAAFCEEPYFHNERYTLNWAGKSDAFKILQERTSATLKPQPDLSVNFESTENVFIEGENLEVLKVLQKSYFNKVKCIIIDPPYNTGNDSFIYPDRFKENLEEYERRIGEKDEEGYLMKEGLFRKNSKESGHYHSNWLNMMLPRLFLARGLLRDDGVIFVHIDDNEVHNLRLLMNEIFGEENFVAIIPWRKRTAKSDVPFGVSQDYEWIIVFSKGGFEAGIEVERKYYSTEDFPNDRWRLSDITTQRTESERPNSAFLMVNPKTGKSYPHNPKRVWGVSKNTFDEYYKKGKIVFPEDYDFLKITIPAYRVFESEDKEKSLNKFGSEDARKSVSTLLPKEIGLNEDGNNEIVELFGQKMFSFPKPVNLVKYFLKMVNEKDFYVLDFFAGSGTTAHAVLELNKEDGGNRKFILVQLPEPCDESSEAYKAGYKTIADISRERIRRVIRHMEGERPREPHDSDSLFAAPSPAREDARPPLGFKSFKLSPSNFKVWRSEDITADNLEQNMELFIDPVKPESQTENILVELLLKSGFSLTDKVEHMGDYYSVNDNALILALTAMSPAIASALVALDPKPQKVLTLDRLFVGDDQLKTNTALQMRDAAVEFKTI